MWYFQILSLDLHLYSQFTTQCSTSFGCPKLIWYSSQNILLLIIYLKGWHSILTVAFSKKTLRSSWVLPLSHIQSNSKSCWLYLNMICLKLKWGASGTPGIMTRAEGSRLTNWATQASRKCFRVHLQSMSLSTEIPLFIFLILLNWSK